MAKLLADEGVDVTPYEYRTDVPAGVRSLERYPELSAHSSSDPVALPFDDGRFDAVLSCGVLEHVQDPHGSLEEAGVSFGRAAPSTFTTCPTARPTPSGSRR